MKKQNLHRWIAFLICLALILPQGFMDAPVSVLAAAGTGTVTATSLNVRTGPGLNYDKVSIDGSNAFLKNGDKVTIISEKSGWYKISFTYGGKKAEGYVMDDYIKTSSKDNTAKEPTKAPTKKPTKAPTKEPTKVPTKKPTKAPTQEPVQPPKDTDSDKAVSALNIPALIIATNVNVRKSSSTSSAKVTSVTKGYKVTVLKEVLINNQKWYQVSFKENKKTATGYVLSDYIKLSLSSSLNASVNSSSKVKVRRGAGENYSSVIDKKGKSIALSNKTAVTIIGETTDSKKIKWFKITFTVSKIKYTGYIPANRTLIKAAAAPTSAVTPKPTQTPKPTTGVTPKPTNAVTPKPTSSVTPKPPASVTPKPTTAVTPTPTKNPAPTVTPATGVTPTPTKGGILSDAEFEAKLNSEGFPESYKPYLRQLHQQYPTWVFEGYQSGFDWNMVITRENALGVNLISNGKSLEWKSFDTGAYNWTTDKFIPFDGSTWVTASKAAVEYYMDPRNFLNDKGIFQFELLTYKSDYQDITGVEGILYNTPLYNSSYSYQNDSGQTVSHTYSETFIEAAKYSGVSPFHLASRVKQEVVTGSTTLSTSVSGTVPGYEGYYNFYNIGAYNSTAPGGAVANGLKYAKTGTTNQALNTQYLIPWDNPYDAIVGGAYIIGSNYINRGQDTIYLQKFNITPTSTFSHQYMANIEAPNAEAKKTYSAYSSMTYVPIVFSIPIYNNMPVNAAPVPSTVLNPNNWLKTLKVDGYSLTPTFDLTKDQPYSLIVENSAQTINVSATTVSSKATVMGTGIIPLQVGNNTVTLQVTAENGNIRQYVINVFREGATQ